MKNVMAWEFGVASRLPEPSWFGIVLGAVLVEGERMAPGFTERVRQRVESETTRARIPRLREPELRPKQLEEFDRAEAWINLWSPEIIAQAALDERAPRPKKRKH